jgi:Tol biopolymer transport system component
MSPEQICGDDLDGRTDLFSLGALLYEMATGRRPFEDNGRAETLDAVLHRQPVPPRTVNPALPPMMGQIIEKALEKRRDRRYQKAADMRAALVAAQQSADPAGPADYSHSGEIKGPLRAGDQKEAMGQAADGSQAARTVVAREPRARLPWIVAAVFAGVAALMTALLVVKSIRESTDARAIRFVVRPPDNASFTQSSAFMAVSPDAHSLAFVASTRAGKISLWIQSLDSLAAREIVTGASQPFWSPDSRFVAFNAGGKLQKLDLTGGVPQALANALAQSGAWSRDGVILFKPQRGGVYRISSAGGTVTPATTLDPALGETAHDWPQFLPDGRHFLYLANSTRPEHDNVAYVASLDSTARVRLFRSDSQITYAPPGFLIYMLGNTLLAQPFDASHVRVTGDPIPIANQVERNPDSRRGAFSVSQNGVLAYRPIGDTELVWFDRTGSRLQQMGSSGRYSNPALSPDDRRVAVAQVDPDKGTTDIWLFEVARAVASRFTADPASSDMPLWSPDGSRVLFRSHRGATWGFYQRAAINDGHEELIVGGFRTAGNAPLAWSPDGRFLVYADDDSDQIRGQIGDLWLLPWSGDRKPVPFLKTPFKEVQAQVSPDGRWIAYVSNESGSNEVYVRPFPSGDGRWRISEQGGSEPAWRRDGHELFYLAANQDLMAAAIRTGSVLDASQPTRLFGTAMSTGLINASYTRNQYVATSDGQRFLINQSLASAKRLPVTVVINWTAVFKK